jgi:Family of unknown function (DUF5989)
MGNEQQNEFEKAAREKPVGLGRELRDLLRHNRKWWLLPILAALAILGILVVLGATGAAPFIYTLF